MKITYHTKESLDRINYHKLAIPDDQYINELTGDLYVGTRERRLLLKSLGPNQLANKQDKLISGTNIKTINGDSILGSGNLEVGSVESVTGLNTNNTDPLNPVVEISVDGVTIIGDGTPGNPLISVGGGDLQDVTDLGNTTTNDIQLISNAEVIFGAGGGVLLDNASRLREGTIDAGFGGSKGIAQICAVGYELKWEAGRLYVMDGNGLLIRHSLHNFTTLPSSNDDLTKGYYVGSLWTLDSGIIYICTDSTTAAAIWVQYYNPVAVDGVTITGDGTAGNPLVSVSGGGSVNSVTDDGNGVVTVDNTDPVNPVIEFNGVNVDGTTVTGDGTSGNPLVATGGILHGTASGTDTYTTTITGVTSYADGDAYLIRFTNGNTTGCTLNINSLGAITLYRNNDGQLIGGDIISGGEMLCVYNSTTNRFQVIGTAPNSLFAYVTNDDSVTITKGQPVYAFGGTGDRMTVKRAFNTSDATSAQTVGFVLSTSIATNQKGLIMMQGLLDGLSILPTATWSDGDPVYLGATAGTITNVKPSAPNHLVYLGFVTTASNGSAGRLYVRVQNGYELDELHNVQAQTPALKDTLWYDNTVSPTQWKTASIPTILGYTPISSVTGTIGITIDGGGSAITTGVKGYIVVPNARTITGWYVVGAPSGSIVVDVWKANASIPTVANTITGTEKPTLSSSQYNSDLSLSTWTTALVANDVIVFNVDSATTITKATIVIVTTAP